jgi:ClpP class serine protease
MLLVLMGLCCRADNAGVTSFVRVLNFRDSLQAVSLLVHSCGGQVAAVPLTSRIHEGLVFSNRDARSLLDKLVARKR